MEARHVHHRTLTKRRIVLGLMGCLLLAVGGLVVTGCGGPTLAERNESLGQLKMAPAEREHFAEDVVKSTIMILINKDPAKLVTRNATGEITSLHGDAGGSGAILTEDGYILTAAHCVNDSTQLAVLIQRSPTNYECVQRVRVVWKGDPKHSTRDLALIKVNAKGLRPLAWADRAAVRAGDVISGAGMCVIKPVFATAFAGVVKDAAVSSTPLEGHAAQVLGVRGPMGQGDSGGPIVTAEGRLLGVLTTSHVVFIWPDGTAAFPLWQEILEPDPGWIGELIEQDRLAHPGTGTAPGGR